MHRIAQPRRIIVFTARRMSMAEHDHSAIKEHMTVVGADGVHVGTVDHLDGERNKLTKRASPQAEDGEGATHHYLPAGHVASVEGRSEGRRVGEKWVGRCRTRGLRSN